MPAITGTLDLVTALGDFVRIIASGISTFAQFIVHFNGYPLLFGVFALMFACRFLLAPWIANTIQGGASDKVKKPKGGSK